MEMTNKRGAPLKTCPDCQCKLHARKSSCDCGYSFYEKKRRLIDNWKTLKKGDIIRSLYGNGPYWQDPSSKERQYMGSYGRFVVDAVGNDYIRCYEITARGIKTPTGTHLLYMGGFKKSELCDNLFKCPHKLVSVS